MKERMNTKISVIVPIYNVEQYLEEMLESLRAQTFDDFDVLMINDGSPDNSDKILIKLWKNMRNLMSVFDHSIRKIKAFLLQEI